MYQKKKKNSVNFFILITCEFKLSPYTLEIQVFDFPRDRKIGLSVSIKEYLSKIDRHESIRL